MNTVSKLSLILLSKLVRSRLNVEMISINFQTLIYYNIRHDLKNKDYVDGLNSTTDD